MPAPSVSTAAWRRLYDAALRFRDLTPWHVLNEAEIFGVRDPSSNEIGYCSVLGEAGDSAPQPELHNLLLSTMRKFRCIPFEVMVRDRLLLEVLKPLSSKLGFQVKVRKELPAITRARSSLSDRARR